MARIVAGMASSHAFTFMEPEHWDRFRDFIRGRYAERYGQEPPVQPQVAAETLESNQQRYGNVREGLATLRTKLAALRPDALIIIGDDQDENFNPSNLPQFAIYTGDEVTAFDRGSGERRRLRCHRDLAETIHHEMVEAGFDLASSRSFPNDELLAHAHGPALKVLDPDGAIPVVPLFVNAIHVPAPTPARCYQFGEALRAVLEARPGDERVALYASGGLSHFTAGFPWPHYQGPHTLGAICEDFDRQALALIREGRGRELSRLSSRDLLENGDIEMRQWIVLLGALGEQRPDLLVYEPFYRGVLGMGVGYWELEPAREPALQR